MTNTDEERQEALQDFREGMRYIKGSNKEYIEILSIKPETAELIEEALQSPAPVVDVEALKNKYMMLTDEGYTINGWEQYNEAIDDCVDHIASQGYLSQPQDTSALRELERAVEQLLKECTQDEPARDEFGFVISNLQPEESE